MPVLFTNRCCLLTGAVLVFAPPLHIICFQRDLLIATYLWALRPFQIRYIPNASLLLIIGSASLENTSSPIILPKFFRQSFLIELFKFTESENMPCFSLTSKSFAFMSKLILSVSQSHPLSLSKTAYTSRFLVRVGYSC